jgi:hypothetical protein
MQLFSTLSFPPRRFFMSHTVPFSRTLPDELTVSVDGELELDHDITERPAARVVVTMPDFVADGLAHLLTDAARVSEVFDGSESNGVDGQALADALYAAATSGTYRCRQRDPAHAVDRAGT